MAWTLRDAGYDTGYFGKWHIQPQRETRPNSDWHGFDTIDTRGLDDVKATADRAASDAAAAASAAEQARAAADRAAQAAAAAQSTADQALAAATEAQACCEANTEKMERMFQKSMSK